MVQKVNKTKTPQQALASLQRTCSRMERSKNDVRKSLIRFGIEMTESEKIIAKLEADKYIDERRYASSFVREKSSLQKWSKRKIYQALIIKGIPTEYIDSAISEEFDENFEKENLQTILSRKYETLVSNTIDPLQLRRKLFTFAASKGYDIDEINDTIELLCQK